MSKGLDCSQEKGEVVCEKSLISSELACEKESSSLAAEVKGDAERVRKVSQDEILMKEKGEIERNAGTNLDVNFSICSRTH